MSGTRPFFDRLNSLLWGGRDRSHAPGSCTQDELTPEAPLRLEWATYQSHKHELLSFEGQWVVIHGDQILGIRPTFEEALKFGYQRLGFTDFPTQQILESDPVHSLPPQPV
jgi:hypothetical protein